MFHLQMVEDVPLAEFLYLAFTSMPGGVILGSSGLSCCVPCLSSAIISPCLVIPRRRSRPHSVSDFKRTGFIKSCNTPTRKLNVSAESARAELNLTCIPFRSRSCVVCSLKRTRRKRKGNILGANDAYIIMPRHVRYCTVGCSAVPA